jgi:urease accessory protein
MAMGGLWGTAGPTLPLMEPGIALSVTGLGALIYVRRRWPLGTASGLLVVFGTLHGYAHGQEAANSTDFAAYAAGFVTATGLLLRTGIALGQRLDGIPRLYRACGAVMGLVGTSLLALGF